MEKLNPGTGPRLDAASMLHQIMNKAGNHTWQWFWKASIAKDDNLYSIGIQDFEKISQISRSIFEDVWRWQDEAIENLPDTSGGMDTLIEGIRGELERSGIPADYEGIDARFKRIAAICDHDPGSAQLETLKEICVNAADTIETIGFRIEEFERLRDEIKAREEEEKALERLYGWNADTLPTPYGKTAEKRIYAKAIQAEIITYTNGRYSWNMASKTLFYYFVLSLYDGERIPYNELKDLFGIAVPRQEISRCRQAGETIRGKETIDALFIDEG